MYAIESFRDEQATGVPVAGIKQLGASCRLIDRLRLLGRLAAMTGLSWTLFASTALATGVERNILTAQEREWLTSHAAEIRVAPEGNYPPFSFTQAGTWQGLSADVTRLLQDRLGTKFQLLPAQNLDTVLDMARRGDADVVTSIAQTPERAQYLSFTPPYFKVPTTIIVRASFPAGTWPLALAGKTVAVGKGYGVQKYLEEKFPSIHLLSVADDLEGLRKLSFGEVDAVIMDVASASFFIERDKITNLRVLSAFEYSYDLRLAVRKDLPVLSEMLSKTLASISEADKQAIFNKWVSLKLDPMSIVWARVQPWLPLVGGLLTALLSIGGIAWHLRGQRRELELGHRFRQMFEHHASTMLLIDPEGGAIVDANAAAGEFYGYPVETLRTMQIGQINTLSPAEVTAERKRAVRQERDHFVFPHRLASGEIRTVEVRSSPISIDKRTLLFSIVSDVTERLKMEHALKESEQRYRALVDLAPEGVVVHSAGKLDYINQAGAAVFGATSPAELIGKPISDFVHPDFWERVTQRMAQVQQSGQAIGREQMVLKRLDGTDIDVETAAVPIVSDGKRVSLTVFRDITESKRQAQAIVASERRLRSILEASPVPCMLADFHNRLHYVNPAFVSSFGYSLEGGLTALSWWQQAYPEPSYRESLLAAWQQEAQASLVSASPFREMEVNITCANGQIRTVVISAAPLPDSADDEVVITFFDITERKRMEEMQRIAASAFESQQGMFVTDAHQVILRVNKMFTEITGYSAKEALGQTPHLLSSGRHDAAFYAAMWESIGRSGVWLGEIYNRRKNGRVYPQNLSVSAVKNEAGLVTHYVGAFSDVTAHKAAEEQIEAMSFSDLLTGLPNRRHLAVLLQKAMIGAGQRKSNAALLLLDLDHFQKLNDAFGRDCGDLVLNQVAKLLKTCVREVDYIARVGGDEFGVLIESLGSDPLEATGRAETVAREILRALAQPFAIGTVEFYCSASIGITMLGEQDRTVDETLEHAELAMYHAKAGGRDTLRFFDPQMQAVVSARMALEMDLRQAIAGQQFLLYYQAQVNEQYVITGVEVLVRWRHPERGMVSPADFIPLAEETGLILPIGNWVLESACEQLALWAQQSELAHLSLAINVSARQFRESSFVAQVLAALERTGANPQRLKLELTESILLADVADVINKMSILKTKGIGFAIDDFGTGYSSLAYLKQLPIEKLKIDQSFVRNILIASNEVAITKAIIAMADSLGLSVIAEGVETRAQCELLASLGCHNYQGYLFSRPVPVAEFELLARRGCSVLLASE